MRLLVQNKSPIFHFFRRLFVPFTCFLLGYLLATSINDSSLAKRSRGHDEPLIILILSAVGNRNRRDACRETWLTLTTSTKHWFVVGTDGVNGGQKSLLDLENQQYNDMLILPSHNDSYSSLTQKLVSSMQFINTASKAKFVLKVDDDSFVRLDLLESQLISLMDGKLIYWGYFSAAAPIQSSGIWKETRWFLCDKYLPYAVGGGYILSSDLIEYIATNADLLQHYTSEDVSVGTWLSPLKIKRIHDTRFDTWWKSRGCSDSFIVTHKKTPNQMRKKMRHLKEHGKMCFEEKFDRGYSYNWTVLPSKCCGNKAQDWAIDVSSW